MILYSMETGDGANKGAFQLFKTHSLATNRYFAQITLVWAEIDALVTVHQQNI